VCRERLAGAAAGCAQEPEEQVRHRDAVPVRLGDRAVDRPAHVRADRRLRAAGRRGRLFIVGALFEGGANVRRVGAERADDGAGQPGRVVEDRDEQIAAVDRVVAEATRAGLGVAQAAERFVVEVLQDAGTDQIVDGQLRDQRCVSLLRALPAQAVWRADVRPRTTLGANGCDQAATGNGVVGGPWACQNLPPWTRLIP
jgi:hypothetical protein